MIIDRKPRVNARQVALIVASSYSALDAQAREIRFDQGRELARELAPRLRHFACRFAAPQLNSAERAPHRLRAFEAQSPECSLAIQHTPRARPALAPA